MMRNSNSKGKVVANSIDSPVENGLSQNERLPTIQIDTVPSPPWSPAESISSDHNDDKEPLDEGEIDLQLQEEDQQIPGALSEDERESVRSFVEDVLSKAMVVAEKKLKFVGVDDEDDEEAAPAEEVVQVQEESEPVPSTSEPGEKPEPEEEVEPVLSEEEEAEIREAATKVVEEVLSKAQETVSVRLEKDESSLDFPGLPTFQIDTVKSAPPSPESEEELPQQQKKWSFRVKEDSESDKKDDIDEEETPITLITFDEAPEDVKDAASSFVKEIVGKAITMAEEKAVPNLPFNFEDVDLIKSSGPWYVRVREGFMRVLRSACFCTPRRNDS